MHGGFIRGVHGGVYLIVIGVRLAPVGMVQMNARKSPLGNGMGLMVGGESGRCWGVGDRKSGCTVHIRIVYNSARCSDSSCIAYPSNNRCVYLSNAI